MAHKTRIMYIEEKPDVTGQARIGRVRTSKTGRTLYYDGKTFQSLKGAGFKANYFDLETGDEYWISGCKKDGADRLSNEADPVYIDDDVREEYWTTIRSAPERTNELVANR
jgi:hypothetical protein